MGSRPPTYRWWPTSRAFSNFLSSIRALMGSVTVRSPQPILLMAKKGAFHPTDDFHLIQTLVDAGTSLRWHVASELNPSLRQQCSEDGGARNRAHYNTYTRKWRKITALLMAKKGWWAHARQPKAFSRPWPIFLTQIGNWDDSTVPHWCGYFAGCGPAFFRSYLKARPWSTWAPGRWRPWSPWLSTPMHSA